MRSIEQGGRGGELTGYLIMTFKDKSSNLIFALAARFLKCPRVEEELRR